MEKLGSIRHQAHLRREAVIVFILSLIVFTVGLGHREFINLDAQFVLFAQEMWQHGVSLFPTAFGRPTPEYSGVSTIFIYVCSLPWGHVSKISAVLPSAILSALTLAFIYLTTAPLSRKWGTCGVLLALFTQTFFSTARSVSLEPYTMLITTLGFYYAFSCYLHHKPFRWIYLAALLIIGFLCEGPIGLIIPAVIAAIFFLINQDTARFAGTLLTSIVSFTLGTGLLLLAAFYQGGHAFMMEVSHAQLIPIISNAQHEEFFYYFYNSLGTYAIAYPLAIITFLLYLPALCRPGFNHHLKLLQIFAAWTAIILIVFSFFDEKSPQYALAITPAIALLSAYLFVDKEQNRLKTLVRKNIAWAFFIFPTVGAILAQVAKSELEHRGMHLSIEFASVIMILIAIQTVSVIACLIYHSGRKRETIAIATAAIVFIVVNIMIVEPILLSLTQSRRFVTQVELLRANYPAKLVFYRADKDALVMRYVINSNNPVHPILDINTPEELSALEPPVYVIMTEETFQELPEAMQKEWHILMQGQVGREAATALSK